MSKILITANDINIAGRFTMQGHPARVVAITDGTQDHPVVVVFGEPGNEDCDTVKTDGTNAMGPDLKLAPKKGYVAFRVTPCRSPWEPLVRVNQISQVRLKREAALDEIRATGKEPNVYVTEVEIPA